MTIGFAPRYFRTSSCSLPPSLDTTALYIGVSTTASRCGGRGAAASGVTGAGAAAGAGGGVAGVGIWAGRLGAGVSRGVGKKNI